MRRYNPGMPTGTVADRQEAIDAADVVGSWDWDIPADRLTADAPVSLLFNIDPDLGEAGVPFAAFEAGIHPDDRARVASLIAERARAGRSYLAEYRVRSADGETRRVLARGRFRTDAAGRPHRGRGIIVDITPGRIEEDAPAVEAPGAPDSPLERAARSFLEGHRCLEAVPDAAPLRRLADLLLFETGRALAAQESRARRRSLN